MIDTSERTAATDTELVDARFAVVEKHGETPGIVAVALAPVEVALDYLPGQYIVLTDSEASVAPRSYSIANVPRPDGMLSLLVSVVPGGETSGWIGRRLRVGAAARPDRRGLARRDGRRELERSERPGRTHRFDR